MKRAKDATGDALTANTCPICGRATGAHRVGVLIGVVLLGFVALLIASGLLWVTVHIWVAL